jgi:hypothetical protein
MTSNPDKACPMCFVGNPRGTLVEGGVGKGGSPERGARPRGAGPLKPSQPFVMGGLVVRWANVHGAFRGWFELRLRILAGVWTKGAPSIVSGGVSGPTLGCFFRGFIHAKCSGRLAGSFSRLAKRPRILLRETSGAGGASVMDISGRAGTRSYGHGVAGGWRVSSGRGTAHNRPT